MRLKIVTKTDWPSFWNVAIDIGRALRDRCTCTINDWGEAKPGGNILFIGTIDDQTLTYLDSLLPGSNIVLYATTEGLTHLNGSSLAVAERLQVVAPSHFVEQLVEQFGIPVAGVVHHGIDMQNKDVDTQLKWKFAPKVDGRTVFLTISSNHPRKGLDQLLQAFKLVEEQDPEALLILHSQRQGYFDLDSLIRALDLERVYLTNLFGKITTAQLNGLYELCASYVQPSHSEGFGLPVLEAFRFDKPSIAVDAPPFNEIIDHGENGILIPTQGYRWLNYDNSVSFRLNLYSAEDLARAMSTSVTDRILLSNMQRKIEHEKWRWDSHKLYPALLEYFN